jgi:hypothetical protein
MEGGIFNIERKQFQSQNTLPSKAIITIEGEIKTFHDKQKLKQCTSIKPALQNKLKEILHTEDENKQPRMIIFEPQEKNRQVE